MPEGLDTQKIWNALTADPVFAGQIPAAAQAVFREMVDDLPRRLAPHLDKKVTAASFMEAKLAVLDYSLETGFVGKVFAAFPEGSLPLPAAAMAETMVGALKMMRGAIEEIIRDPAEVLGQSGMDERQMLAHPQGGRFTAATLSAYDAGSLTIGALLETQPASVLIDGNG